MVSDHMGGISSRYNVARRQNQTDETRRRSNISGRSAKSCRSSRSSSQPSITVRSPIEEGGFEELVHEPATSIGIKKVLSKKMGKILPCIIPQETMDPQSSSEACTSFGKSEIHPRTPVREAKCLSTRNPALKDSPSSRATRNTAPHASCCCNAAQDAGLKTSRSSSMASDNFPIPPPKVCKCHLSVELALIQLYLENPPVFLRRYRYLISKIPLEILYEVAMKERMSLPIKQYERHRKNARNNSDCESYRYSKPVTNESKSKRIPLPKDQLLKRLPPDHWGQYTQLSRSEGSDLLYLDSYWAKYQFERKLKGQCSRPSCSSPKNTTRVQVHTMKKRSDTSDDSV